MLTPQGLGVLRIGEPIPAASSWAASEGQISDQCIIITSPEHPGAYGIMEGGRVRRVTIGQRSDLETAAGIGTGATEAEVRAAYRGLVEERHVYIEAPGKYLTGPEAGTGAPALRFEIGRDREVTVIHAGTMPVLGYVEGCA